MYLVGTQDVYGCYTTDHIQVYRKSKASAAIERKKQIANAFHGEIILCYDKSVRNGYKELFPPIKIRKKTDARMGEDRKLVFMFGNENRKKFLKFKYLGKI
jgi:hypothetical protein